MTNCLIVGMGGFLGAVSRYLLNSIPMSNGNFPFTTMLINFIGALLIGIFTQIGSEFTNFNPQIMLFLTVGLCGGFTTFSTFSLETLGLLQDGKIFAGVSYILFSFILCLGAVIIGKVATKMFLS
ncbi:MAG: fluoride efflux transporter CrcB [Clostridiales bacterium]